MFRGPKYFLAFALAFCCCSAEAQEESIEDEAGQFIMNYELLVDALRNTSLELQKIGNRRGVTAKDRACFFGIAREANTQLYNLQVELGDITLQEFIQYRREEPNDAREWAQEIVDFRDSLNKFFKSVRVRANNDCITFED